MRKKKQRYILLTFDLEEFDLPLEFHEPISAKQEIEISRKGLHELLKILEKEKVVATFFVTAKFALANKNLIKKLAKSNEIALHGMIHSDDYRKMRMDEVLSRLRKARKIVEGIAGKKVIGFRAPRFHIKKVKMLSSAGLRYDSSLHPTYIPGRYNNFFTERRIHHHGDMTEIPVSVTPIIRLPLFWFAFRNLGLHYAEFCTRWCVFDSGFAMTLFHPWEFVDLNKTQFKLPAYIRRNTGKKLVTMLTEYIGWAKRKGHKFSTVSHFLSENGLI